MARSTSMALLVVVAFAAAASVGSAQLLTNALRTGGSQNGNFLGLELPPPPGVALGQVFRDMINGVTGGKYAAGVGGQPKINFKPEIKAGPLLNLLPINFAPSLSLSETLLALTLSNTLSTSGKLSPGLDLSAAGSVTGPSTSTTIVNPPAPAAGGQAAGDQGSGR